MPITEPRQVPITIKQVLSNDDEIDAHMPMGIECLNILRDFGAVWTRRPCLLKLVKTYHGPRFCPGVPIAQSLIITAVD